MKFFKFLIVCFILAGGFFSSLFAKIHEISALSELNNYVEDSKPMVIFNLDGTLVTYQDAILENGMNGFMKNIQRKYGMTDAKRDYLMSIILKNATYKLTDAGIIDVLNSLSDNQNVFGFSTSRTGKFGVIKKMERWKSRLLAKFDIKFKNYKDLDGTIFSELIPARSDRINYDKNYPIFINGIFFAGKVYQNKALSYFLDQLTKLPDHVIMIDNKKSSLRVLQRVFQKRKKQFIGLYYKKEKRKTDSKIVRLQEKTLMEKGKWISDKDASEMLKKAVENK